MIQKYIGKQVIIRTYSAGVHFGVLVERDNKEVLLKNARRIWSWSGALSLSEIASVGLKKDSSKISVPVDGIILTEAIEIMPIHKTSNIYNYE